VSSVKSVERAFSVLQCLSGGSAGVSDVAERTDLPKSTVSRLLSTLENIGVVEQIENGGHYRLGAYMVELAGGGLPSPTLIGLARSHLVELVELSGEAAGLSVLDEEGMVFYLDQVDSDHAVQISDWTGERLPSHCVSSGIVLLSRSPDELVRAVLATPLESLTPRTETDPTVIAERIDLARPRGIAWSDSEAVDEIASVAAVITGPSGEAIGAIHIHGPSYRFPGDRSREQFEDLVAAAAERIGVALHPGIGLESERDIRPDR
jgi:DNA-binding IclR family transcriptional regulator